MTFKINSVKNRNRKRKKISNKGLKNNNNNNKSQLFNYINMIGVILFIFALGISSNASLILDDYNSPIDKGDYLGLSSNHDKIEIMGNQGWIDFKNSEGISGNGTTTNPYVIQNLIIDGQGSGDCIKISDSNAYFIIQNCTVYNSGSNNNNAGIMLENIENGQFLNNTCFNNLHMGILLLDSNYNFFSNNNISNNGEYGLYLENSGNNILINNTLNTTNILSLISWIAP